MKVVKETYWDRFGGVSKVVNPDHYPPPEGAMDAKSVVRPVSAAEVSRAVRGMKIGSACGPEGLLPKKDPSSTNVNDWIPLTIASVMLRLYTKILARRIGDTVPLNPRQQGFIRKAAGCAENLTTLRCQIQENRGNIRCDLGLCQSV